MMPVAMLFLPRMLDDILAIFFAMVKSVFCWGFCEKRLVVVVFWWPTNGKKCGKGGKWMCTFVELENLHFRQLYFSTGFSG
jgi:hypothetical protein